MYEPRKRDNGAPGYGNGGSIRSQRRRELAKRRRLQKQIAIAAAGVFLVLVLSLLAFLYSKLRQLDTDEVDVEYVTNPHISEEILETMKGYTTFAIFGIDARTNDSLGKGNLSDVIMICNINNETGEVRLLSVYRDTYLDVNGDEDFRKINSAYALGGPEQALRALNQNLDCNITKYVTFNWKAVADVINILGGVTVEITASEYGNGTTTGINGYIQATKEATGIDSMQLTGPGVYNLDGIQAVAYARLRKMDTDFQRTERQRRIISLAMDKAKQADLNILIDSIDAVLPCVKTNFSLSEMVDLVRYIPRYHIGDTAGFPTKHFPMVMGKQGDCVVPDDLSENVAELHAFLFDNEDFQVSQSVLRRDEVIRQRVISLGNAAKATTAAASPSASAPPETSSDDEPTESRAGDTTSAANPADNGITSSLNASSASDESPSESETGASELPSSADGIEPDDNNGLTGNDEFPTPTSPQDSSSPTAASRPSELMPGTSNPASEEPAGPRTSGTDNSSSGPGSSSSGNSGSGSGTGDSSSDDAISGGSSAGPGVSGM